MFPARICKEREEEKRKLESPTPKTLGGFMI
jgi:hypothetical protein